MQHYAGQAFTDIVKPASSATITVRIAGTSNNAAIYSDDGVTVKSNPFTANVLGQFDFYAASGKYDITVSGTQVTTYTLANQVLFDPFETVAADTPQALKGSLAATTITASGLISANAGLTVASGQVLSADQVTPVNSSGVGGFYGRYITPPFGAIGITATFANEVRAFQFVLPYAVTVSKVTASVSAPATGAADVGIYSLAGNRLIYTNGAINTGASVGAQTLPIVGGPVTLIAGVYYFAQTITSVTPQMQAVNTTITDQQANNGGVARCGQAANSSSGGVLPATLGVISPSPAVSSWIAFFER